MARKKADAAKPKPKVKAGKQVKKVARKRGTPWFMYVLSCGDGSLYCGITTDVEMRLGKHRKGTGARYTRGRGPLVLLGSWRHKNKSAALKAELAFKKLRRCDKEAFVAAG